MYHITNYMQPKFTTDSLIVRRDPFMIGFSHDIMYLGKHETFNVLKDRDAPSSQINGIGNGAKYIPYLVEVHVQGSII